MMIVIHHRLTTASKPAAKHAKPSSLKYADTTKRKTDKKKKYTYIFIYIFHRKRKERRGRRWRRSRGGGLQSLSGAEGRKDQGSKGRGRKMKAGTKRKE